MTIQSNDLLPISEKDIDDKRRQFIQQYLVSLAWTPQKNERVTRAHPQMQEMVKQMMANKGQQMVSILKSLERLGNKAALLSVHSSTVANAIATGYAIGAHVGNLYEKSSGLQTLRQQNEAQTLTISHKPEFENKMQTKAIILTFAAAYYTVSLLSKYETEAVSARVIPMVSLPEFNYTNAEESMRCALFYYGNMVASEAMVSDDIALVRFTIDYFNQLLKEIELVKSSLKYTEEFENRSYKLEGTEFTINGFNAEMHDTVKSVEFKRVSFNDIVGNRDSKHAQRRSIQRLLCYDLKEEKNPMLELGGMPRITLGKGIPGTGKSLLIAATATELMDRCKALNIPFLFLPFPSNVVSEYQGASAQRALDWFKPQRDKTKIIYAPVDDAENNFPSRGMRSISAGTREVISIFLTETEGAGAVYRGNTSMTFFTNRPEDLDTAVLSRIEERSDINGATTWQDFADQDYNWYKKYEEHMPGFINLNPPKGYKYFENQKLLISLSASSELSYILPKNEKILEIYDRLTKQFDPKKDDEFYARFYEMVKKSFPFIASRDMRNVQTAVSKRIMDFDFPAEWWDNLELFFALDYQKKKNKLIELMKATMKGLSFGEIRLQEAVRYIDTTVKIYETTFETSVREQLEQMQIRTEAVSRFEKLQAAENHKA